MEREQFDTNFTSFEIIDRANKLLDGIAIRFDENYQDVYSGVKNKTILYAGDFIYGTPRGLILEVHPEIITIEETTLLKLFEGFYSEDVVGMPYEQRLQKEPEPQTEFLSDYLKSERGKNGKQLEVLRTYYNLKSPLDGSDILMTIDKFLMPKARADIPISWVWTLRRFDNGGPLKTNLLSPGKP